MKMLTDKCRESNEFAWVIAVAGVLLMIFIAAI